MATILPVLIVKNHKAYQDQIDSPNNPLKLKQLYLDAKQSMVQESDLLAEEHVDNDIKTLERINFYLQKNKNVRNATENSLVDIVEQRQSLAANIDTYLNKESPTDKFKRKISEYFTLLVGIVIAGFFGISFKYPAVAQQIFSGESGLQFVTLFAVVIAIILFGVIGILDAKELAALLGGLSGYILGRTSAASPQPAGAGSRELSEMQPAAGTAR